MLENTQRQQAEAMLAFAKMYRNAGLSVIPIAAESKRPVGKWKLLETQLITDTELERRYLTPHKGRLPNRLGVIGGAISGGLEMLDFDAGGLEWDNWKNLVVPTLLAKLQVERTFNDLIEMMDLSGIVDQAAKKSLAERKEEERRKRILQVLAGSEEPMTLNRLRTTSGINSPRILKVLEELTRQGVIQESSDRQYATYHLTTLSK